MLSRHLKMSNNRQLGRFLPGQRKPLMAMVEITNSCNMTCPVCFSDANSSPSNVPIYEIQRRLEQLLEVTETPIPIQISGGEPTIREDLPQIIELASRLGYRHIELITNGIEIGKDFNILHKLKTCGLTAVYLQFDGLKRDTLIKIRGQDMTEIRHQSIEAIRNAKLCCTLAVVVARGVNEGEIGDIVRFGIDHIDVVRAINFQAAVRFSGRFEMGSTYRALSIKELLNLIEVQTGITADTFLSKHIGHSLCNAMSYIFLVDGKFEPLFKYIRDEDLNAFLGEDHHRKIMGAFAGKKAFFWRFLTNPAAWKMIAKAAPIFGSNPYNILRSKHILLFAKGFMEKHQLNPERIDQCCYAITGADGVYSLCAYNNLYRFVSFQRKSS